jgi:hypothetical protein
MIEIVASIHSSIRRLLPASTVAALRADLAEVKICLQYWRVWLCSKSSACLNQEKDHLDDRPFLSCSLQLNLQAPQIWTPFTRHLQILPF